MRRATLAVVLATGALSVPAVALAAGDGDSTSGQAPANNTPVQTQEQQPDQQQQAPKRGDCPNHDGGGDSSSGGGSDSQTTL